MTQLPLQALYAVLPELSLAFVQQRKYLIVHLAQLLGYPQSGVSALVVEPSHVSVKDGPYPVGLLRRQSQGTFEVADQHLHIELRSGGRGRQPSVDHHQGRGSPDDKASKQNNQSEKRHAPAMHLPEGKGQVIGICRLVHCITHEIDRTISVSGSAGDM